MSISSKKQNGWRVIQIKADTEKGAIVTLAQGTNCVHFDAPEFGVGRRKEAAALAKFAAHSGLGEVTEIFHHLLALPVEYNGRIPFPADLIGMERLFAGQRSLAMLS
jgi:hypothetical protein